MRNRYRALVILLSIFILNLMFPMRVNCQFSGNTKLLPDNFIPIKQEWKRVGADYQIDSNDSDVSYIWFNYTLENGIKELSKFTFQNIKVDVAIGTFNVTSILNVTLNAYYRADTPGSDFRVKFYWWNGSQSVLGGSFASSVATYHFYNYDLSSILDTPLKVQNVHLSLTNLGAPSYDNEGRITYLYLDVSFTYEEIFIYPLRLVLGLIGLAIMVISPTIGVREVLKKRNYEMIGGCMALFCIGYALVIVWLIP